MRFNRIYPSWILSVALLFAGCALDQGLKGSAPNTALKKDTKPPGAGLHVEMARMLGRAGETGGAEVHYQEALKLEPHDLAAQLGYARLLVARGEAERACGWFEKAQQGYPKSATVHNDLGLCYAECDRLADAVVTLRRAVELKPEEVRYRNNLARMLIVENQTDEALRELLAVHPPAVAHYNTGYLLQSQGKRAAAAENFQKAAALDPSLVSAGRWKSELAHRDQLDAQSAQMPTRLPGTEIQ